jgi:8-oxo-dGTP pyrophosphatase MutT (NUDIX family)
VAEQLLGPGPVEPPGAPPRPWRLSGRLLVLDPAERLLLVRSRDPAYPELGEWWEVPGGGVDPGETTVDAALREVTEETGIRVARETIQTAKDGGSTPATWRLEMTYLWLGERRWSRQAIHLARPAATPQPEDVVNYTPEEQLTFLGAEWVPVRELSGLARTFPDAVGQILAALQAGEEIDDGFRVWC